MKIFENNIGNKLRFPLNKLNLWKYLWFIVKKITLFFDFQREEILGFIFIKISCYLYKFVEDIGFFFFFIKYYRFA